MNIPAPYGICACCRPIQLVYAYRSTFSDKRDWKLICPKHGEDYKPRESNAKTTE